MFLLLYFQMFRSFSRYLHHANNWNKHNHHARLTQLEMTNQQVSINNDNSIEHHEIDYNLIIHRNNNVQFSS